MFSTGVAIKITYNYCKIVIWKAQGMPKQNNANFPKLPEEEEITSNRNDRITSKY